MSTNPFLSFAHRFSHITGRVQGDGLRFIGLDVHLDFCEIAICENGRVRSAGRVPSSPAGIDVLVRSLAADDQVALEATGNALKIARLLEPHVARWSWLRRRSYR